MSKNLVRNCAYLRLDVNQPKPFNVGDRVKLRSGPYAGEVGKVVALGTRSDSRLRVRVWPGRYGTMTCVDAKNVELVREPQVSAESPRR